MGTRREPELERTRTIPASRLDSGWQCNPYGTSVTAGGEGLSDAVRVAIRAQSKRLVMFAAKIAECGEPGDLKVK
jgi:hypothetical protein